MKKLEILGELPKCDAKTGSEQILLEKWHRQTCLMQGCHKPSNLLKKKAISEKHNKAKYNKMRYACTTEHYSALKNKAVLSYSTTWINLDDIMLSEIRQSQKHKHCMILRLRDI